MKQTGVPVLSLRGVDFRFWSPFGISGKSANIFRVLRFRLGLHAKKHGKKIIFNPDFSLRGKKECVTHA